MAMQRRLLAAIGLAAALGCGSSSSLPIILVRDGAPADQRSDVETDGVADAGDAAETRHPDAAPSEKPDAGATELASDRADGSLDSDGASDSDSDSGVGSVGGDTSAADATLATSCAKAVPVTGDTVPDQDLASAGPAVSTCGAPALPTLFYTVEVPAGQRLIARPSVQFGIWIPRVQVLASCGATQCLATDHPATNQSREASWINNGPAPRTVVLAVAGDPGNWNAHFDLMISIAPAVNSCASPTPLSNSLFLLSQDPLQGTSTGAPPGCELASTPSLFYQAMLLPGEMLSVNVEGTVLASQMLVRDNCDPTLCLDANDLQASITNWDQSPRSLLIELFPFGANNVPVDVLFTKAQPNPSIIVKGPSDVLRTSEDGGHDTFQVFLASAPTAPVIVDVKSSRPGEAVVSPTSLRFDPTNWSTPATVTVTGVDDTIPDGPVSYTIQLAPSRSDDPSYDGIGGSELPGVNDDNEPGFTFEGAELLTTAEDGTTDTFTVRLNRRPTANVKLPLTSSDVGEATLSPGELVFTPDNWNTPQAVTVTGVDDTAQDGLQELAIVPGTITSADPSFSGLVVPDLPVHNADDDFVDQPLTVISGVRSCQQTSGGWDLAVDDWRRVYALAGCGDGTFLLTNNGGGTTVFEARPVPVLPVNVAEMIAGRGGEVYVVADSQTPGFDPVGFDLISSSDAGKTWRAPIHFEGTQLPFMAVAGETLLIWGDLNNGSDNATILWRSTDAGRTLRAPVTIAHTGWSAAIERDAKTVWLSRRTNMDLVVRGSTDRGATFGPEVHTPMVLGDGFMAATSAGILTTVSDPKPGARIFSYDNPPRVRFAPGDVTDVNQVLADGAGNFTLLASPVSDSTPLVASRFGASAAALSPPVAVGPSTGPISAAVLSRRAISVLWSGGGLFVYAVKTWP